MIVSRLADVLMVQALRIHIGTAPCDEPGLRALADAHVGKALTLIHQQPAHPWTVEGLASAVGRNLGFS